MSDIASSPPTRRVVTVVELLMSSEKSLSTTEVARTLGIARATATAILAELESAGWVRRDDGMGYSIGPALARVGNPPAGPAVPALAGAALAELARTTRCGVTMSLIELGHFTVVAKEYGGDRIIKGLPMGQRVAREFPVGAAVMPWRTPDEREHWLATSTQPPAVGEQLLRRVRRSGYAIFRPSDNDAGLVEVLADLLGAVGSESLNPTVHTRAMRQLSALTSRFYTEAEIRSSRTLPISYLTAPVFDRPDHAQFEVQLGPLRAEVSKTERDHYVGALLAAAEQISEALRAH